VEAASVPKTDPENHAVKGDWHIFAPEEYAVTKVAAILGGIEVDDESLADAAVGEKLHLSIPEVEVAAVQYRKDGTKRVTLHATEFKVTRQVK
jgi:hypothetical protein